MKIVSTILKVLFALLIAKIIINETRLPSSWNDEYYIVNFEDNIEALTKEEENSLISLLGLCTTYKIKERDNVKITKLAYQTPFRHESVCYIFFKVNPDVRLPFTLIEVTEDYKEYVCEHVCAVTRNCEDFSTVRKLVDTKYSWSRDNDKKIEYTRIEEPYRTESKDKFLEENYEVVSGKTILGEIIDITDRYLEIQQDDGEIKLVKIDWKSTNFWDCIEEDSLTMYDIDIGDYFEKEMIIKDEKIEN